MTRAEHIQHALLAAITRHEEALNASVGVSGLHIDLKFDPVTGLAKKAILRLEMENFLASRTKEYTFTENEVILGSTSA